MGCLNAQSLWKRCDTKFRLELVKVLVPTYKQKLPPTVGTCTSRPSTLQKELHYKMTTSRENVRPQSKCAVWIRYQKWRGGGGDTFTGVQIMKFGSAFKTISRNVTLNWPCKWTESHIMKLFLYNISFLDSTCLIKK